MGGSFLNTAPVSSSVYGAHPAIPGEPKRIDSFLLFAIAFMYIGFEFPFRGIKGNWGYTQWVECLLSMEALGSMHNAT